MSESRERTIERLEEHLEGAEEVLSSLRPLDEKQARRIAQRMDRLQSQLLAASEPPEPRGSARGYGDQAGRS